MKKNNKKKKEGGNGASSSPSASWLVASEFDLEPEARNPLLQRWVASASLGVSLSRILMRQEEFGFL
ncbi:hypothetical protein JTE90_025750 [Oedothorax gibbosus]|uniref:Uncharacterized protein n=1 Tax=Oedothorax gibbosus TaxID=931172 RepID=A0AAV6U765_9ARAC|nr:hypothetical protein JTE90_025750 [Oedothorax gibbosus]